MEIEAQYDFTSGQSAPRKRQGFTTLTLNVRNETSSLERKIKNLIEELKRYQGYGDMNDLSKYIRSFDNNNQIYNCNLPTLAAAIVYLDQIGGEDNSKDEHFTTEANLYLDRFIPNILPRDMIGKPLTLKIKQEIYATIFRYVGYVLFCQKINSR